MYEEKCKICGKIRYLTQPSKSGLCRSCAKKLQFKTNKIDIPKKHCKFCGELFTPNSNNQIYCKGPHYRICPVCGKQYLEDNVENLKNPPVACSYECRIKLTQQTSLKKYGIKAPGNNLEAREKAKQTMIKKLGVQYAMQSQEVREKAKKTLLEKYDYNDESKNTEIIKKTLLRNYETYFVNTRSISKINLEFQNKLLNYGIESELNFNLEDKFYSLKIKNSNILIEIDLTYTHNIIGNHWGSGKDKNYHVNKTITANKYGYRCIHVWDWDDWDKVINLIMPKQKIDIRDCTIYKLIPKVAQDFVAKNHLYGSCRGQIFCLGLVKDDEIYQVMTFGKSRYDKKYSAELLKMCSKPGYEIIDGYLELFKYATENFGLTNIVSYCDISKFDEKIYENLGMKFVRKNPPQKIWSKGKKYITSNLLQSKGYNHLFKKTGNQEKSNDQLMLENGWLPIYTCGQAVHEFK